MKRQFSRMVKLHIALKNRWYAITRHPILNATATDHDGSVASIHASHPSMTFMRLVHMIKRNSAMNMSREDILEDLHNISDVVVQIKRVREGNVYRRYISDIYSAFN